jgi:hypothetical protein
MPLRMRKAQAHTRPTAQHHGTARRGLASRGTISASLEGSPPRSLEAQLTSISLKAPSAEAPPPPAGPRHGANTTSLKTTLGRLGQQPNHPTGQGTFTRQLLHSMGRGQTVSAGVDRHAAQRM